jgi:hypothetical protein
MIAGECTSLPDRDVEPTSWLCCSAAPRSFRQRGVAGQPPPAF